MITVNHISYLAGRKKLLEDVSFSVKAGQLLAIIGSNGAGKSTLLKLLCKEITPAEGSIRIRNRPLYEYRIDELSKFRSVLSQQHTLSISFRVDELVMMGRYPHFDQHPSANDRKICQLAMEEIGIAAFASRDYNTLSGGEQQRVQLARVIAQIYDQPGGVLFMDEPTNGLDLLYQQQILQLARRFADRGYTVVCILHDINFASRFADRILMLKEGKRVCLGSPNDVINEQNIYAVFGIRVKLIANKELDFPLVIPAAILLNK